MIKWNKMKNLKYLICTMLIIVLAVIVTVKTNATNKLSETANTDSSISNVVENPTNAVSDNADETKANSSTNSVSEQQINDVATLLSNEPKDINADVQNTTQTPVATPEPTPVQTTKQAQAPATKQACNTSTGSLSEDQFQFNTDASKGLVPTFKGYTKDDLFCLTVAIYQEAGGDKAVDSTRIYVGNVIVNRLHNKYFRYAKSIRDVVTAPRQYGLLYKTGVVFPARATDEPAAVFRAEQCAIRVLEGERPLPSNVIFQAEFQQGDYLFAFQDGNYFCGKY